MGATGEDFGGRYGFPGFYRVLVSTTGLESFSLRPEKFPKNVSFGGGRVLFCSAKGICNDETIKWANKKRCFCGKPCLCQRDTRHFRRFRHFTGFEQLSPCFAG